MYYVYMHTYNQQISTTNHQNSKRLPGPRAVNRPLPGIDRESTEVRKSTRVVLGDMSPKKGWCGIILTVVSCCPRSLRDLPP